MAAVNPYTTQSSTFGTTMGSGVQDVMDALTGAGATGNQATTSTKLFTGGLKMDAAKQAKKAFEEAAK
jgi:hypothetical protein